MPEQEHEPVETRTECQSTDTHVRTFLPPCRTSANFDTQANDNAGRIEANADGVRVAWIHAQDQRAGPARCPMHTASARFLCRIDLSEDKWRMACWTHMPRLELENLTRAAGVRLGGSKHFVVDCVRVAGSDVLRVAGVEETAVHVQPENTLCRFSTYKKHAYIKCFADRPVTSSQCVRTTNSARGIITLDKYQVPSRPSEAPSKSSVYT